MRKAKQGQAETAMRLSHSGIGLKYEDRGSIFGPAIDLLYDLGQDPNHLWALLSPAVPLGRRL